MMFSRGVVCVQYTLVVFTRVCVCVCERECVCLCVYMCVCVWAGQGCVVSADAEHLPFLVSHAAVYGGWNLPHDIIKR